MPQPFRQTDTKSISTQQVLPFFFFILAALWSVDWLMIDFGGRAASQIVENIEAGTWTASGVLEAYVARAAQAQQAMNCLTEGTCAVRPRYSRSFGDHFPAHVTNTL